MRLIFNILILFTLSATLLQAVQKIDISGDDLVMTYDNGKPSHTTAVNVTISTKYLKITGDNGEIDYKTDKATIYNNVKIYSNDTEGSSDKIVLNLKTEEIETITDYMTLKPNYKTSYFDEDLFIKSKYLNGKREAYNLTECQITGCNRSDHQHYLLKCKEMSIYPSERIVLKDLEIFWHGKQLMGLPIFVIPLDERYNDSRTIPQLGFDTENGYFAKFAYPYNPKNNDLYGLILIDIMSNKGLGLGITQDYMFPKSKIEGTFGYYRQIDFSGNDNDQSYNLKYNQSIGNFGINLEGDFREYYYQNSFDSQTQNYSGKFNYTTNVSETILKVKSNYNNSNYSSRNTNYVLSHNQRFSKNYTFTGNLNLDDYKSGDYSRELLTTDLSLTGKEALFDWRVNALLYDELDENKNSSNNPGIEKRPEISLTSDATRLNLFKDKKFNIRVNVGFSNLLLQDNRNINRNYFEAYIPEYKLDLNDKISFGIDGRYKQFAYSDDTAKYSLGSNTYFNYKLNKYSSLKLDYRFQNPTGYSPVASDYISTYNYGNVRYIYDFQKNFKTEIFSGYDFNAGSSNSPWQDLNFRFNWTPSDYFSWYLSSNYDLNGIGLGNIISQLKFFNKDKFSFDVGLRYDNRTGKLISGKSLLNCKISNDYLLGAFLSYDGYDKRLDYIVGELTRKYHCYDLSLLYKRQTGYYSDSSIMLYVKLNIFPDTKEMTVGSDGTAISTGVGDNYF